MPNRILKESICYSDDIDCLTAFEETVFYRLMVRVDDFGRMDARPAFLCSQLFASRTDIAGARLSAAIDRLAEVGLIALYTVADKPYLYLVSWQKHQRLRSTREKYPAPPKEAATGGNLQQAAAAVTICRRLLRLAAICNKLLLTRARNPNPNLKPNLNLRENPNRVSKPEAAPAGLFPPPRRRWRIIAYSAKTVFRRSGLSIFTPQRAGWSAIRP